MFYGAHSAINRLISVGWLLSCTDSDLLTLFLESTLKRHGYYCRSRKSSQTTRSRSCISCVRAKARCDNRRPGCSRCVAKATLCHYPTSARPKDPKPRIQYSHDNTPEQYKVSPSIASDLLGIENRGEPSDIDDILLGISDPEFANFSERNNVDWDYPDINFAEFLDPQVNDGTIQGPSSGSSALVRPSATRVNGVEEFVSSPNTSILLQPTGTPRSLFLKTAMKEGTQRTANLMLHTLKSYALMMLRHKTLPPFVHSHLISSNAENIDMEPLNNCISLLHMISGGVQGSRKLFWKNVRLECEHLCESVRQLYLLLQRRLTIKYYRFRV